MNAYHHVNGLPTLNHNQTPLTPTPMDLSVIATPTPARRLAKLTPAEYDYLKSTGGCFRCRQGGHLAQNCPTYRSHVNALSTRHNEAAITNPENYLPQ